MRVIAGEFRSRALVAPPGVATRPTSDRLRETLFNVLANRGTIAGLLFADLFAGSGAVGIEAISRGAAHCIFVEDAPRALACLKKNLTTLGIGADRATIFTGEVSAFARKWPRPCDIVYLDPPYEDDEAYTSTLRALASQNNRALKPGALVLAEHAAPKTRKGVAELADQYGKLQRTRLLQQSDAALSFYELQTD